MIGTEKLAVWSGTLWQSKLANQSCTHWFGSSCLMMFIFFNRPCYHQHVWPDSTSKTSFLHQLHWAVMLGFEHKVAPYPMAYSLLESPFFVWNWREIEKIGPILDNTRAAFWCILDHDLQALFAKSSTCFGPMGSERSMASRADIRAWWSLRCGHLAGDFMSQMKMGMWGWFGPFLSGLGWFQIPDQFRH